MFPHSIFYICVFILPSFNAHINDRSFYSTPVLSDTKSGLACEANGTELSLHLVISEKQCMKHCISNPECTGYGWLKKDGMKDECYLYNQTSVAEFSTVTGIYS